MTLVQALKSQRVVFHLGFRKTGTSTIQRMLTENAALWGSDVSVSARDDLTLEWRRALSAYTKAPSAAGLERLDQRIRDTSKVVSAMPERTVIISDENLTANKVTAPDGSTFSDWTALIIPMIERAFMDADVRFVIYTRSFESWIKSCYNQAVKKQRLYASYANWRKALPSEFDWNTVIPKLQSAATQPLVIVDMSQEAKGDIFLGSAVLKQAGIPDGKFDQIVQPQRQNESLDERTITLLRVLNFLHIAKWVRPLLVRGPQREYL